MVDEKKSEWFIKRLVALNLFAFLLLLSWLFEPTRGEWLALDEIFFRSLNNSLREGGSWWRLFWAATNSRIFDFVFGSLMLLLFIVAGLRAGRQQWAHYLALITVASIAIVSGAMLGHLLSIDRVSGTVQFADAYHLSEAVGFKTKDFSYGTFPGDHGLVAIIVAGYALRYLSPRYYWPMQFLALFFVIPRLVGGAHWLSDELVGAAFVALIVLSWSFCTPLARWALDGLTWAWQWLLDQVLRLVPE